MQLQTLPKYDYKNTTCGDCCQETNHQKVDSAEWYMVLDRIWEQVNENNPRHILCIGCLEKRLGRKLTPADFTDAPLNTWPSDNFGRSDRLRNRLGVE